MKGLLATLSITARVPLCSVLRFIYCYAECRYAECHYAECRGAILTVLISFMTFLISGIFLTDLIDEENPFDQTAPQHSA
jgi:hypothetical protein